MRKPVCFFACAKTDTDQLRNNCNPSTSFFQNFKSLAIFNGCTRLVLDLVGNPDDRFSRVWAHMIIQMLTVFVLQI